jgi:hypothetical protein
MKLHAISAKERETYLSVKKAWGCVQEGMAKNNRLCRPFSLVLYCVKLM